MMKNIKVAVLLATILLAVVAITYSTRAFIPGGTYTSRLALLEGWSSRGFYGLNCSGFLTNAHGEAFMTEQQMYAGEGNLEIRAELASRSDINEAVLKPGDIAAFHGSYKGFEGAHVAAYMGHGVWVDGDSRRGFVAEYRLQDKPAGDPWFEGRVRILRWKSASTPRFAFRFFEQEQAAIAAEIPATKG